WTLHAWPLWRRESGGVRRSRRAAGGRPGDRRRALDPRTGTDGVVVGHHHGARRAHRVLVRRPRPAGPVGRPRSAVASARAAAARLMPRPAAIFDLDGTLLADTSAER